MKNDKKHTLVKQMGLLIEKIKNNGVQISFSIGAGSILAFYIIEWFKNRFLANANSTFFAFEELSQTFISENVNWSNFEAILLLLGFIGIFTAPLLYKKTDSNVKLIVFSIIFIFADFLFLLRSIALQKVDFFFMFVMFLSSVFFIWLCCAILKILNQWIRNKEGNVDIPKITLVWTIIIAIFGLTK